MGPGVGAHDRPRRAPARTVQEPAGEPRAPDRPAGPWGRRQRGYFGRASGGLCPVHRRDSGARGANRCRNGGPRILRRAGAAGGFRVGHSTQAGRIGGGHCSSAADAADKRLREGGPVQLPLGMLLQRHVAPGAQTGATGHRRLFMQRNGRHGSGADAGVFLPAAHPAAQFPDRLGRLPSQRVDLCHADQGPAHQYRRPKADRRTALQPGHGGD